MAPLPDCREWRDPELMARVLGDKLEKNVFVAFSFLTGESQQVSARKDIGGHSAQSVLPKEDKPRG